MPHFNDGDHKATPAKPPPLRALGQLFDVVHIFSFEVLTSHRFLVLVYIVL